ncbi:MAG: AAA family ATPase, partial [Pirellulales bacterium]|nr:AAA family ATPase [Pirellulales bacterium]
MLLSTRLIEYVQACFTGLWIESNEHDDAMREMAQMCRDQDWQLLSWNVDQGLCLPGQSGAGDETSNDPLAAIKALNATANPDGTTLLVLVNFHRFLQSAEIVQALARQIHDGKQNRTFVVVLSAIVDLPVELEKLFVVLEHDLPDRQQLEEIARGIATEDGELPEGDELNTVLDAAVGLTRYEVEGACSLSLVREGRLTAATMWEHKAQMLKKSGLVSLHRGGERFDDLGGLDSLKSFCLRAMRRQAEPDALRRPRGVMLLGVPGTGKSAIAKALGNETQRPTLSLDIGSLMGSLVGTTESNIRQALRIADAMAPAVLYIDEVEKGLSGVASSGQTDSGVTARLFSTFLTWLNDHESDVFVVCTCNDISKLPPEFSRAERFDGIFFLDLPSDKQRQKIW